MADKKEKKLSLKQQLQKDVVEYNQRIAQIRDQLGQVPRLTADLNQIIGAKAGAKQILKEFCKDAN